MLRLRPNVALWILCLPHFALVSRGMVPQVRDILPCCQMPFAASSCAAAAASAVGAAVPGCEWAPAAAGTAQLCAGSCTWPFQLCHGTTAWIPAAGAGEQLLPDGEGSCFPGLWRWLEPVLLGWGGTEGLKTQIQLLQLLGSDHPARDLEEPVCHPALQLFGSSS